MEVTCMVCGKKFLPGNDEHGIPNGVGFMLEDGSVLNMCSECIMSEKLPSDIDKAGRKKKHEES